MHFIYLDESGNTGTSLTDVDQPIFVLCALIVPESQWLVIEKSLTEELNKHFPKRPDDFEVHANELINARTFCRPFKVRQRLDFISAWFGVARQFNLKVIYRAITKKRYAKWIDDTFGPGVVINPHNAAFLIVSQVVNNYLKHTKGSPLGILIFDENQDITSDVEKSIRLLRGSAGSLHLSQIIEKGFFIESHKSLLIQLADLCAYGLRRMEEQNTGIKVKALDQTFIPLVEPLIHRGAEPMLDVLAWLESQQKKEQPGN